MNQTPNMSGVVKRYRTMAILAGIMSLLLWFVDLPVAYLFDNESWKAKVTWIPFVHGWNPASRFAYYGAKSCIAVFVISSNHCCIRFMNIG